MAIYIMYFYLLNQSRASHYAFITCGPQMSGWVVDIDLPTSGSRSDFEVIS